ncbi:hypothetical protein HYV73_03965 [Candidatus Uhrbacteria bacterium]|nr:hypothetical protein [Candidatus Uhrbacteria bacterium]
MQNFEVSDVLMVASVLDGEQTVADATKRLRDWLEPMKAREANFYFAVPWGTSVAEGYERLRMIGYLDGRKPQDRQPGIYVTSDLGKRWLRSRLVSFEESVGLPLSVLLEHAGLPMNV